MTAFVEPRSAPSAPPDAAVALGRLAARAGSLYSLPVVAMRVLELTNHPSVDARALKECIENDPALTGKLLRVVNSSLFGLTRHVSDLNQALALLGIKPLKLLVLGFSLPAGLYTGIGSDVLARYWRHTLTKAVAGRELCETLWKQPGDDAFIAGLLQDLGTLLLIQELGDSYVRFLDRAQLQCENLAALETRAMGFDHTQLSAEMLRGWGLPTALVEAVAWKPAATADAPAGVPLPACGGARSGPPLPQIVHLAELLAQLLADGRSAALAEILAIGSRDHGLGTGEATSGGCRTATPGRLAGQEFPAYSAEPTGDLSPVLTRPALDALVESLQTKVDQLADVLKLQLPAGVQYQDVLLRAHAQLAAVAATAAEDLLKAQAPPAELPQDEEMLTDFLALAEAVGRIARRGPAAVGAVHDGRDAVQPASATVATVAAPTGVALAATPRIVAGSAGPASKDDAAIVARLAVAVAACRQARRPLSLLLAEVELRPVRSRSDASPPTDPMRLIEELCRGVEQPGGACVPRGPRGFALLLPNCERREAIEIGSWLVEQFRASLPDPADGGPREAVLAIGVAAVALPPKNFPPHDLLSGAARCLYGAHASGGSVVKSIEIY